MLEATVVRKIYQNNQWKEYAEVIEFECKELEATLTKNTEYDQSRVQTVSVKEQ